MAAALHPDVQAAMLATVVVVHPGRRVRLWIHPSGLWLESPIDLGDDAVDATVAIFAAIAGSVRRERTGQHALTLERLPSGGLVAELRAVEWRGHASTSPRPSSTSTLDS